MSLSIHALVVAGSDKSQPSGGNRVICGQTATKQIKVDRTMVRHRVYARVTTYDVDDRIQRDSVGVGGRRTIGSSKVEFNCDTANGQNVQVVVRVTIDDDGKGAVEMQCPTEFKFHLNKPK